MKRLFLRLPGMSQVSLAIFNSTDNRSGDILSCIVGPGQYNIGNRFPTGRNPIANTFPKASVLRNKEAWAPGMTLKEDELS